MQIKASYQMLSNELLNVIKAKKKKLLANEKLIYPIIEILFSDKDKKEKKDVIDLFQKSNIVNVDIISIKQIEDYEVDIKEDIEGIIVCYITNGNYLLLNIYEHMEYITSQLKNNIEVIFESVIDDSLSEKEVIFVLITLQ